MGARRTRGEWTGWTTWTWWTKWTRKGRAKYTVHAVHTVHIVHKVHDKRLLRNLRQWRPRVNRRRHQLANPSNRQPGKSLRRRRRLHRTHVPCALSEKESIM